MYEQKQRSWLEMFTLVATLKAKPGKEAELTKICTKLTKEVHSKEKDCLLYVPHVAKNDPTEIVVFEKFTDEQAFNSHAKSAHFIEAAQKFDDLLAGPPQLNFLSEL